MRWSILLAVLGLAVLGAAETAHAVVPVPPRTPGAEPVVLRGGNGRAVVTKKGFLLARVASGRIRVIDLPGGRRPARGCNRRGTRVSASAVEYRGPHVSCWVQGRGPWQVVIRGKGIHLSGVARGSLTLDAVNAGPTGSYRIAQSPFKRWPRKAKTFTLAR